MLSCKGSPALTDSLPSRRHISPDALSDSARETVVRWIEACNGHDVCRPGGTNVLPKRLLDVGTAADTKVRLVSATHAHEYVALTHCWGKKKPLSTTQGNEEAMREEVPWDLLPQTFQDAIRVIRWLDRRFIWIDSLCIVQDSARDWEEEAAKMAGIYSGCELLIASSRAASCEEGFLQLRSGDKLVLSTNREGKAVRVYSRKRKHEPYGGPVPYEFFDLPLFSRGWCFQERLMAPRTLYFTKDELYFQCRKGDVCECDGANHRLRTSCHTFYRGSIQKDLQIGSGEGKDGKKQIGMNTGRNIEYKPASEDVIPFYEMKADPKLSNRVSLIQRLYRDARELTYDSLIPLEFGWLWAQLVADYTALNLTYTQDILPALSGVASLMLAYKPGQYFAGIWQRDIHYLLGWVPALENESGTRPEGYTAPSFSWASRIGPVTFEHQDEIIAVCRIMDIRCHVKGVDPYGQVTGGSLTLLGKLAALPISFEAGPAQSSFLSVEDAEGNVRKCKVCFDTGEDREEWRDGGTAGRVFCFELFRSLGRPDDSVDEGEQAELVHALVLKTGGDENRKFQRIGVALQVPGRVFDSVPSVEVAVI